MIYMLDTNICIYIIKNSPRSVIEKFHSLQMGDIGISSITLAELEYGVAKSAHTVKNQEALTKFIFPLDICDFDSKAAEIYGNIRVNLEKKGKSIGSMDMLIAAHAISLDVRLITNNEKEFNRIKHLQLENWVN